MQGSRREADRVPVPQAILCHPGRAIYDLTHPGPGGAADPAGQIVTVVNRTHTREVAEQLADRPPKTILVQPANRETGPGILLPVVWIHRRDPQALVAIFPSDHFIQERARFMAAVRTAAEAAAASEDLVVLLRIEPEAPDPEYGWILPGTNDAPSKEPLLPIAAFREKPDPATALRLYRMGALWNTLVLIAKASTLLEIYAAHLPELAQRFHRIRAALGSSREAAVLEAEYAAMPSTTISHGLLEKIPTKLRVLKVTGVLWSDWGNLTRICQTLDQSAGCTS